MTKSTALSGLYSAELRSLLPEPTFQKLIGILEIISKNPAQRHVYESLQRAARDKVWQIQEARREARREGLATGREEGEQLGIAKGQRIGQIRLLEKFLNVQQSEDHKLAGLTLPELDERVADLQTRLNSRGDS